MKDHDRISKLTASLRAAEADAFICTLPKNVLLVSGYWPVVGLSVAVITREGWVGVLAPEDEEDLAGHSWADLTLTFSPSSLHHKTTVGEALREPLKELLKRGDITRGKVCIQVAPTSEPAPYASMYLYGDSLVEILQTAAPELEICSDGEILDECSSVKTAAEIQKIAFAAKVVRQAFLVAQAEILPGRREVDIAAATRGPLSTLAIGQPTVRSAEGYAYCMSGPNAAQAYAAYQRSRDRELQVCDLALIHVNSTVNGYWTDVTRTYSVEIPTSEGKRVLTAIQVARSAALDKIRPGVLARDVDHAARKVLEEGGSGKAFRHPLGHGVGFSAFDHSAKPCLSPYSKDVLEPGMIFNVEPGIYLENRLGARHCDMVEVTSDGYRVLTEGV